MSGKKKGHTILRQVFEVDIESKAKGHKAFEDFKSLFYEVVLPILEKVFDEIDEPDQIIRLNQLEIDLGDIQESYLAEEIVHQLEQKLTRAFREKLMSLPVRPLRPGEEEGRIPITRSNIENVIFFLRYGVIPSNAAREGFNIPEVISELITEAREEFLARLEEVFRQNPAFIQRIVSQLPVATQEELIRAFEPARSEFLTRSVDRAVREIQTLRPGLSISRIRNIVRAGSLRVLFLGMRDLFRDEEFLKDLRQDIAREAGISKSQLFPEIPIRDETEDQVTPETDTSTALQRIAERIVSGEVELSTWMNYPESQKARIWEYILRNLASKAVVYFRELLGIKSGSEPNPTQARAWEYLFSIHTDALRAALVKTDSIVSTVRAVRKVIPKEVKFEVVEWLFPGQEARIADFVRSIGEVFFRSTGVSSSQDAFREKVYDKLIEDFSASSRPVFSPREAAKSIKEIEPALPDEVEDVVEVFEKENWEKKFDRKNPLDLPEFSIQVTEEERIRATVVYFLTYGEIPWWSQYSIADLPNIIPRMVNLDPSGFKRSVTEVFTRLDTPGKRRTAIRSILQALPSEQLRAFISALEPEMGGFLFSGSALIRKFFEADSAPRVPSSEVAPDLYEWVPVLEYIIRKGNKAVDTNQFIEEITLRVAADLGISRREFIGRFLPVIRKEIEEGEKRFRPFQMMLEQTAMNLSQAPQNIENEELRKIAERIAEREAALKEIESLDQAQEELKKLIYKRLVSLRKSIPLSREEREEMGITPEKEWEWILELVEEKKISASTLESVKVPEAFVPKVAKLLPFNIEATEAARILLGDAQNPVEDSPEIREQVAEILRKTQKPFRLLGDQAPASGEEQDKDLSEQEIGVVESPEKDASADEDKEKIESGEELKLVPDDTTEVLDLVLQGKPIPEKFGQLSQAQVEIMIREFIRDRPAVARLFFTSRLQQRQSRETLVKKFPKPLIYEIMAAISPSLGGNLAPYVEQFERVFHRSGSPVKPEEVLRQAIKFVAERRQITFSPFMFIRESLAVLAKSSRKEYLAVAQWVQQNIAATSAVSREVQDQIIDFVDREVADLEELSEADRIRRQKDLDPDLKKKEELPEDEPLYIDNAGLVLMQSLLPMLFKMQGYITEENQWVDEEKQHRAVYLMEYLVFRGSRPLDEANMALNKVLAGLPVAEVLMPFEGEFTEKEMQESGHMLTYVAREWDRMKEENADGIRESFMIREGRLEFKKGIIGEQDGWRLRVKQTGFDVLLGSFPFSFGKIKYEWMVNPILVEWT